MLVVAGTERANGRGGTTIPNERGNVVSLIPLAVASRYRPPRKLMVLLGLRRKITWADWYFRAIN